MTVPTRILVAEEHPLMSVGLVALANAEEDLIVVGASADPPSLLRLASELKPDVLLVSSTFVAANAARTTRDLLDIAENARILVLAGMQGTSPRAAVDAWRAHGFAYKEEAPAKLPAAIRASRFVEGGAQPGSLAVSPLAVALSQREADVLRMSAQGRTLKQIAATLRVSARTLETYKARAMTKLGFTSRFEVVRYATMRGWLLG